MVQRQIGMSIALLVTIFILFLRFPSFTKAQQPSPNPLDRIGWIVGQWIAADPGNLSNPLLVHLDAKWSEDKKTILVTCTRDGQGQKVEPQFQTKYSWNAATNRIVVSETRANTDRVEGEVTPEGNDFVINGHLIRSNGSTQDLAIQYSQWALATLSIETTSTSPTPPVGSPASTIAPNLVFLRQKPPAGTAYASDPQIDQQIKAQPSTAR